MLAAVAAIAIAAPNVSYAQFGGLMGAATNAAKGKAADALINKVMGELEKKFTDMVAKESIPEAAKANIVKKLSEMARPIVKRIVDGAMSGSLPNPAEVLQSVMKEVLPRIPELVAAAKGGGGAAPAAAPVAAAPQQAEQVQQTAPVQYPYPPPQTVPALPSAPPIPQPAPAQPETPPPPPPKKPGIAVYVFGEEDPALNKAMATRLIIALNNSGRYEAADNYRELFDQTAAAQKGGPAAVSFKQFRKLGEQSGVEYVCVAEITTVFGEKQVSGHILKVDATGIAGIGAADVPLRTLADLTAASEQMVDAMAPRSNRLGALNDARDGKTYKTVNIGGATWMAENLNYKTASGSWCYYGNTDSSNCDKYGGRLYDWNTATGVCPSGWHLPSRHEWKNIVTIAGDSSAAGKKLKSVTGWANGNGTDNYGFAAMPGGYRANNGGFGNAGNGGNWWTYTENGSAYAYAVRMSSYDDNVDETYNYKDYGFSVRCVADN